MSRKEYVDFILEQCEGLTTRAMMGEFVLYYGGKVVAGVYDNRLLVKPTQKLKNGNMQWHLVSMAQRYKTRKQHTF